MRFEVLVLVVVELDVVPLDAESISRRLEVLGVGEAVGVLTSRFEPGEDDCEDEELVRPPQGDEVLFVCFFFGRYL